MWGSRIPHPGGGGVTAWNARLRFWATRTDARSQVMLSSETCEARRRARWARVVATGIELVGGHIEECAADTNLNERDIPPAYPVQGDFATQQALPHVLGVTEGFWDDVGIYSEAH